MEQLIQKDPLLKIKIIIAFACIYLIWGSTYLAIHFANQSIPSFLMAGTRFVVAGTILYLVARWKGSPAPSWVNWKPAIISSFMLLLICNGGASWAVRRVPTGVAAIIGATQPIWIVLADFFMNKTKFPSKKTLLGLLLGTMGMLILILRTPLTGSESLDIIGLSILVFGTFTWAIGSIYAAKSLKPFPPLLSIALQMLSGGTLLILAGILFGEWKYLQVSSISASSALALLYLIFFGSLIGFTAYSWLMGKVNAGTVSTHAFVNPVIAVFLGWAFAGEAFTFQIAIASVVILSGVVLIIWKRNKGK